MGGKLGRRSRGPEPSRRNCCLQRAPGSGVRGTRRCCSPRSAARRWASRQVAGDGAAGRAARHVCASSRQRGHAINHLESPPCCLPGGGSHMWWWGLQSGRELPVALQTMYNGLCVVKDDTQDVYQKSVHLCGWKHLESLLIFVCHSGLLASVRIREL